MLAQIPDALRVLLGTAANSLWANGAINMIVTSKNLDNIGSGYNSLPDDNKPLPEPKLAFHYKYPWLSPESNFTRSVHEFNPHVSIPYTMTITTTSPTGQLVFCVWTLVSAVP